MNRFFTLLLAASCLTAFGQVPDYVPTEGLVAWYPFNGNTNDAGTNGYDGTSFGVELVEDRFTIGNSAIKCGNGGSPTWVELPQSLQTSSLDFTLSFWIKPNVVTGRSELVSRDQDPQDDGDWSCFVEGGALFFETRIGGGPNVTVGGGIIEASLWSNVVVRRSASAGENQIFLNGSLVAAVEEYYGSLNPATPIHIGRHAVVPSIFYQGDFDDFGIWNRALSGEEILSLTNAELPVFGCIDSTACNFNEEALVDDNSCDLFTCKCLDGTVWNAELGGCISANTADINNDGCVQLNDLLDLLSAYGDCGAEESLWQCGDPREYQGYDYATVQIGEQCWFADNLRSEKYSTGDEITSNLSQNDWVGTIHGASCVYGEEQSPCENFSPTIEGCNPEESLEFYGRLYNWFAVTDERGLCPTGWHSPDDNEWQVLSAHLGGSATAGVNMKSTSGWREGGNGDNSSGFNGYPGGDRYAVDGEFYSSGNTGFWWSSTFLDNPQEPGASFYFLEFGNGELKTSGYPPNNGMSVRCLKDTQ